MGFALRARTAAMAGAVTMLAGCIVGISAGGASAESRVNHCGSSYAFLRSWAVTDNWYPNPTTGYIDVYYNSSNGYNCLTVRANDSSVSNANHIQAGIRRHGASSYTLDGPGQNYKTYAGPVYASAPGACIDIYGELSYSGGEAGHGTTVYESVHCG
ncbi:hypothetical protein ACFVW5_04590 [Streptomyces sp. NPDC058232]|uniref:hypothetical protein n=1 Tax=unclassified Streptomyces TaxID=2593676 RepID=UPI0036BE6310